MSEIHLPKIAVIGVGGAGINIVKHMQSSGLDGIDFIVANTDAQSLAHVDAAQKIHLGKTLTQGFGAGGDPVIGEKAAAESLDEIIEAIRPYQMIFMTAGMGGGTGSGAASIFGQVAKDLGILSVAIVTRPFEFEGRKRTAIADEAVEKMKKSVDAFVILQNEKLFELFDEDITQLDAFHQADNMLSNSLKGLTDILNSHGQINLDFADLRSILRQAGQIVLNSAIAEGENRAQIVSEKVLNNPLLDQGNIAGAQQVLIQISGGTDVKLKEVREITDFIRKHLPHFGNLLFGTHFREDLNGKVHISLVASGLNAEESFNEPVKESISLTSFLTRSRPVETTPKQAPEIKKEETIQPKTPEKETESNSLGDFDDLKKFFAFETQVEEENKPEPVIKEIENFFEEETDENPFLTEELIIEEVDFIESDEDEKKETLQSHKDHQNDLLRMLGEIEQNKGVSEELEIPSFLRELKND